MRLRAYLGWIFAPRALKIAYHFYRRRCQVLEDEIRRLRGNKKRDTGRLDWMESANPLIFHKHHEGDTWVLYVDPLDESLDEGSASFSGYTLRDAIDKAMGQKCSARSVNTTHA